MPKLAITGASGGIGGRVARRLADRGVAQRLVVRDPARAPELPGAEVAQASYGDGEAVRRALDGADTLLLVSGSEAFDRVRLHTATVDAAVAAGVRRIVYTSFLNCTPDATFTFARDHWHTEEHIRQAGVRHTFLRDSLYLDYIPLFAGRDGVIRGRRATAAWRRWRATTSPTWPWPCCWRTGTTGAPTTSPDPRRSPCTRPPRSCRGPAAAP